uniref:SMB domain-containing protein n=1 Tax=Nannospalax galili TaxID=1026970 RepID=A0A8C6W6X9_NANGA
MVPFRPLLMLALLAWVALADQESCKGRCTEGFNASKKCQCDDLCTYYESCCVDYMVECKPQVTRGDVFTMPEDEYGTYDYLEEIKNNTSIHGQPNISSVHPDLHTQTERTPERAPFLKPEEEVPTSEASIPGREVGREEVSSRPEATDQETSEFPAQEELCSGKPFDAFTDLKNGSLFAFRGQYCYELDETAVRPGYPKLIRDVWGIEGPIDAAFTRINCQGKTYIFKVPDLRLWLSAQGIMEET